MNKNFENMVGEMCSNFFEKRQGNGLFGDWLDTPEGEAFETMCLKISDILDQDGYQVNAEKSIFIDRNQNKFTFDQVSSKLADKLDMEIKELREYILLWMVDAKAVDEEWEGTQEHVDLIFKWINDECKKYRITLNL